MKTLTSILLYLWQLPQNLLGAVLFALYHQTDSYLFKGARVGVDRRFRGGISLGRYIIVGYDPIDTVKHEYGHCRQSQMLGWLYLPIVGLSSIVHATLHRKGSYYTFWTEHWADRLGSVKRTFIIALAILATGCGTMRKSTQIGATTTLTERTTTDSATTTTARTDESITETATSESNSEREIATVETSITVEYSAPDSLGQQHKLRETTTIKQTGEIERTGGGRNYAKNTDKSAEITVTDTLHRGREISAEQGVAVSDEKERKSGLGGYIWMFVGGIILTLATVIVIWLWQKKRLL